MKIRVGVALKRTFDYNSLDIHMEAEDEVQVAEGQSKAQVIREHTDRMYHLLTEEISTKMTEALKELS
jgi:phosphoribosyl-ATP pyrophosphohydrolase